MKPLKSRSEILVSVVTQNLIKLGGLYGKEITRQYANLWIDNLKGVDPKLIAAAFERIERTFSPTAACPFPVPTHVWDILEAVRKNESKVSTEESWTKALDWVQRDYHPDIKFSDSRKLDEKLIRALKAAGGAEHISGCSQEELQWSKKRFVEAYDSMSNLERDEFFLTDGEAKKVLGKLGPSDVLSGLVKAKSM